MDGFDATGTKSFEMAGIRAEFMEHLTRKP